MKAFQWAINPYYTPNYASVMQKPIQLKLFISRSISHSTKTPINAWRCTKKFSTYSRSRSHYLRCTFFFTWYDFLFVFAWKVERGGLFRRVFFSRVSCFIKGFLDKKKNYWLLHKMCFKVTFFCCFTVLHPKLIATSPTEFQQNPFFMKQWNKNWPFFPFCKAMKF